MASRDGVRALGRYTLDEPIATGTTATIWRARDTRSGREVAVKQFHAHLLGDRVARQRMHNEAKAARRIRGRTIVSAIDQVSTRDEFALVFPFVAGTPLSERLRQEAPLTEAQSAAIAANVAEALAVIHSAGMVHRDVKPGNILLPDHDRAQLLDFGISRAVTDEIEQADAITGAGLAIGTLPYMAPEQLTAQPITGATDVFALGVVLYEMLAGRRPFNASTPVALAAEQRIPPARIEGAAEPLVDVALRAMALDAPVRPTAAQMTNELRGWLAHPAAMDAPTSTLGAAAPAFGTPSAPVRRGVFVATGIAMVLLLIAIVALAAVAPLAAPSGSTGSDPLVGALQTSASPSPAAPTTATTAPAATPVPVSPVAKSSPAPPSGAPTPKPHPKHHGGNHHRHHHHGHHHRHRHGHHGPGG